MSEQTYSLRYRSGRMEVWRWYWRVWRAKYWWWHLLSAAAAFGMIVALSGTKLGPSKLLVGFLLTALILITLMAAWPQVMFKSKERILDVGPEGWSTQIGRKSGSRSWGQVASIESAFGLIAIVSTSGNSILVPERAFSDRAAKEAFLQDAKRWHEAVASR
ncbi:hypothetical protein [Dyella sp. OK004]|uniref:hypothetical protein n=1 Tax=Dyella sp. OK004 TaxID=1855292 RepID=UPI00116022BE|nr:hypothetical protein [Dyella sp. OK004]